MTTGTPRVVYISADMEGTAGIVDRVQTTPPWYEDSRGAAEYQRAREWMSREVAAAARGALAAGADAVLVNDSHNGMLNVLIDALPKGCRLISGHQKPLSMMEGVETEGVFAAFFTGYHARAATAKGILAHTYIGAVADVRINGVSVGEYGVNAATAGDFGVPVTLVTGDDITIAQTQSLLGEAVVGATVKRAIATMTADSMRPADACELIEAAAAEAVAAALEGRVTPFVITDARIDVEWNHQTLADLAEMDPHVERTGDRSVTWVAPNGVALMHTWRSMVARVLARMAL